MFNIKVLIKLGISILVLSSWIMYRLLFLKKARSIWKTDYCINDLILLNLFDYTRYISQNLFMRDFMLVFSSALLDCIFIIFCLAFLFRKISYRPIFNFSGFILLKLITKLCTLEKYSINLFKNYDTGFPSIIFSFTKDEQFISIYPGIVIIIGLSFWKTSKLFSMICFAFSLLIGICLLLLRANFSIDIIFGILLAHYISLISELIFKEDDVIAVNVIQTEESNLPTEMSNKSDKNDMKIVFYDNIN
jgi:hypothetical protein